MVKAIEGSKIYNSLELISFSLDPWKCLMGLVKATTNSPLIKLNLTSFFVFDFSVMNGSLANRTGLVEYLRTNDHLISGGTAFGTVNTNGLADFSLGVNRISIFYLEQIFFESVFAENVLAFWVTRLGLLFLVSFSVFVVGPTAPLSIRTHFHALRTAASSRHSQFS